MAQNLVSVHLDEEQWGRVDDALGVVEDTLEPALVAMDAKERQRKVKMGDASVAFCRQAYDISRSNIHLMPRNYDLDEMGRDLASWEALNRRMVRLTKLMEKARHTQMALGSDVMESALQAYKFLKAAGKGEGVETLKKLLGERFDGNGSRSEPETAPA